MLKKTQLFYQLVNLLAVRDVKVRYQLSILGLYWAVLNPFFDGSSLGICFQSNFQISRYSRCSLLSISILWNNFFWNFFFQLFDKCSQQFSW